jgi:iron complex transport system ATP-binding protein
MNAAVVLRGIQVDLGHARVVDGVDLAVDRGEWVTIIGPNGAGKSTLLRAIGGVVTYRGAIELFGRPTTTLPRRQRAKLVATVAQTPVVPPGMTVVDYVLLGRTPFIAPLGRESAADQEATLSVLESLDLLRLANRQLESLSGGERQRVFLARALAQEAPLLLLDEPTSALDIGHQQEVLELVDRLRGERGLTVLATMHDLSIAGEYADRMALLVCGQVIATGTPREVLTEELLSVNYGARVKVIDGEHGPLVMPVRPAQRPAGDGQRAGNDREDLGRAAPSR